jgi:drug/metabolite transporter (DMT)-like permease
MWGTADYLGGTSARRAPVLTVSLWAQAVGLVAAWLYVAISGNWVTGDGMLWGLLAGGIGALSLALFYAALASGAMSIVAPLSACGAVIPVTIALIDGDSPGTLGYAGMVTALAGAVLASLGGEEDHPTRLSRRALAMSVGAAVGIGLTIALLQRATRDAATDPVAVVAFMRLAGVPALLLVVLATRSGFGLPRRLWPAIAVMGLFDAAANAMFAAASAEGEDSVVAVLGSLYPLTTVLLAAVLLRERPHRVQVAGVMLAFVGVALIAAR